MHSPGQMENRAFRWKLPRMNQGIRFQAAFFAEAHGADIPATVTFNALVKLLHPVRKTSFQFKAVNLGDRVLWAPFHLFPFHKFVRVRLKALACICQFLRAGDAHRNHFLRL